MPIFILLSTLTQQGVQTLKSNPERLREVNKDVEELGCKVLHQWATLGGVRLRQRRRGARHRRAPRRRWRSSARGSTKIATLPALEIDDFLRTLE